jgi:hypothetical protein
MRSHHLPGPGDRRFVEGSTQDREAARRERLLRQVMNSNLPEIARSDLVFEQFGIVHETTTGRLYQARRDDVADLEYVPSAAAFFIGADGQPVLLERPTGAESIQARHEQQAAREQRRNQPRQKPAWMTAKR